VSSAIKVIFLPGNSNSSIGDHWFPSVKESLEQEGIAVIAEEFPDQKLARKEMWIPFLRDQLKADENSVLVGHSSGSIAAMCYAESYPILGSVLVGTYHTDLNMETEKLSGYFDSDWNFSKIKNNQKFISIFASTDDPWIPISEPRYLHEKFNGEYHEYINQGHFGKDCDKKDFPELTLSILHNIKTYKDSLELKAIK